MTSLGYAEPSAHMDYGFGAILCDHMSLQNRYDLVVQRFAFVVFVLLKDTYRG